MQVRALSRVFGVAVFTMAMAGCATQTGRAEAEGPAAANAATTSDSLAQTRWELTSWKNPDGSIRALTTPAGGEPIHIDFLVRQRDYRVAGFSGCNRYMGGYKLEKGRMTITAPTSTRMACADAARNALEVSYMQALRKVSKFALDNAGAPRQMTFTISDGDVLTFTRRADPSNRD